MKLILKGKEVDEYFEYLKKKGDVTDQAANDDVQHKTNTKTNNPIEERELEKEQELSSEESIAQNMSRVNIPIVFEDSIPLNPSIEDVVVEIGLKGFAKGKPATSLEPACKGTFEKWYAILGYEDFKATIFAIHKSDLKNGHKWHRMFVKDVCYFVHYFHSRHHFIDFEILSKCLGSYRNGRPISPNGILKNITEDNAGDTVLSLYNSWEKNNPLPDIDEVERRRELH